MKSTDKLYWIAFCVGFDDDNGKILASALTFWARNRYYALQAITAMLPEHDNWVRSDGTTRPYQLYTLEQCRPDQAEERAMFFAQTFSEVVSASGALGRSVA